MMTYCWTPSAKPLEYINLYHVVAVISILFRDDVLGNY